MIRVMRIQFAWGAQLLRNSCYILFCVRNVDATPWVNVSTLLFCIMIMVRVMRIQLSWGAQVMRNSGCILLRMRIGDAAPMGQFANPSVFQVGNDACNAHIVSMERSSAARDVRHLAAHPSILQLGDDACDAHTASHGRRAEIST